LSSRWPSRSSSTTTVCTRGVAGGAAFGVAGDGRAARSAAARRRLESASRFVAEVRVFIEKIFRKLLC
jgi:hypothetical protein